jgi:hypothetical protein
MALANNFTPYYFLPLVVCIRRRRCCVNGERRRLIRLALIGAWFGFIFPPKASAVRVGPALTL